LIDLFGLKWFTAFAACFTITGGPALFGLQLFAFLLARGEDSGFIRAKFTVVSIALTFFTAHNAGKQMFHWERGKCFVTHFKRL